MAKQEFAPDSNIQIAYDQAIIEHLIDLADPFNLSPNHRALKIKDNMSAAEEAVESRLWVADLFGTPRQRFEAVYEWYEERVGLPLVPVTFEQQVALLPKTQEEREAQVKALEAEVVAALERNRMTVYESSSRVKSDASIKNKQERWGDWVTPVHDIYGIRVVTDYWLQPASNAVTFHFSPPYKYPWGRYAITDYDKELEGGEVRYSARHIIIPFGNRGMQQIAEVQLLNLTQVEDANKSREHYVKRVGKTD